MDHSTGGGSTVVSRFVMYFGIQYRNPTAPAKPMAPTNPVAMPSDVIAASVEKPSVPAAPPQSVSVRHEPRNGAGS